MNAIHQSINQSIKQLYFYFEDYLYQFKDPNWEKEPEPSASKSIVHNRTWIQIPVLVFFFTENCRKGKERKSWRLMQEDMPYVLNVLLMFVEGFP